MAQSAPNASIAERAQPGGVRLELGCGTGENLERLLSNNSFVAYDIDVSGAAMSAARARLAAFKPLPVLDGMDANRMPFKDGIFDFCFGSGVIHHLSLPDAVYELRRILKTNGRLMFLEPLATNPVIEFYRRLTPRARAPDETPLTAKHLAAIRAAFPRVRLEYFGFLTLGCIAFGWWPALQRAATALATSLDRIVFAMLGGWRLAWVVVIYAERD